MDAHSVKGKQKAIVWECTTKVLIQSNNTLCNYHASAISRLRFTQYCFFKEKSHNSFRR